MSKILGNTSNPDNTPNSDDNLIWLISAATCTAVGTGVVCAAVAAPILFSTGVICSVAYITLQPPDYNSPNFEELNRIGYTNEQAYAKLYPLSFRVSSFCRKLL